MTAIPVPTNAETSIQNDGGTWQITTPAQPWSYAAVYRIECKGDEGAESVGALIEAEVEVLAGEAGLALVGDDLTRLEHEVFIQPDGACTVSLKGSDRCRHLLIRTGKIGPASIRLKDVNGWMTYRYDITDDFASLLQTLILSPGKPAVAAVVDALARRQGRAISTNELGALIVRAAAPKLQLTDIFNDELGRFLCAHYDNQIRLLSTYDVHKWPNPSTRPSRYAIGKYFRQTIIRVYKLIKLLRKLGLSGGTVLDVGSTFGYFARPLQLLGYQVTALDRYQDSKGGYDAYLDHLRALGVRVVETSASNEHDVIGQLGEFDAVISMAVIEHVPHTPREFLRMLASHVRPGGILAIDTPNIARYWNRRQLAKGQSVHQPIELQFYADIPYRGHHREYTAAEVGWMLKQVGCRDIVMELFDYNVLQYDELSPDHVEALLAMALDETLCDTILAGGYRET
jgi:2-polyprenyl-3-methyl-5-hydroxy-6-metoxy-1,4-benzoquinol methylase